MKKAAQNDLGSLFYIESANYIPEISFKAS